MVQPDISFLDELISDENQTVSPKDEDSYFDLQVLELFKEKKLFLNPILTLQETSDELVIAKYKLTKIIKEAGYINFYAFVNEQRVQYSKKLLKNLPSHLSMESVVKESGFQARSTYYRVFKEMTGLTPKEYMTHIEKKESLTTFILKKVFLRVLAL